MGQSRVIKFPRGQSTQTPPAIPSISAFHREIMSQDLISAARLLQLTLGIDADIATRCTAFYADKVTLDPEHVREAMGLHELIAGGLQSNALITLKHCFDLGGDNALEVYRILRRRQDQRSAR